MKKNRARPARRGPLQRRNQRGVMLIDVLCTITIIASLGATAIPVYVDLRTAGYQSTSTLTASQFAISVRQAKARWMVGNAAGGAIVDLAGYGKGTLDFNAGGFPVGTTVSLGNIAAVPSDTQCAEVAAELVPGMKVIAGVNTPGTNLGNDYRAVAGGTTGASFCTYTKLRADGSDDTYTPNGNRFLTYYVNNSTYPGGVAVYDPMANLTTYFLAN